MAGDGAELEIALACFEGQKRAAAAHHAFSDQVESQGARILDEVIFSVTPKGKARVYDPRRTVLGALTPALTWGIFGLIASGGSWVSLLVWALVGGVCGLLYAYYAGHLLTKDELSRLGDRLESNSSAILAFVAGIDAAQVHASISKFGAAVASVASIPADLSARVVTSAASPAENSSRPRSGDRPKSNPLLTMLLCRYSGSGAAGRVNATAKGKAGEGNGQAIETELLLRTDRDGRRHVISPSAGPRAFAPSDAVGWAVFGLAFGLIVGFAGNGGFFGALKQSVVTGILWGLFGVVAGALYGLWAGRAVSARRLTAVSPLLPPDTSMVVAWADGSPSEQAIEDWSASASQKLVLRFDPASPGVLLRV